MAQSNALIVPPANAFALMPDVSAFQETFAVEGKIDLSMLDAISMPKAAYWEVPDVLEDVIAVKSLVGVILAQQGGRIFYRKQVDDKGKEIKTAGPPDCSSKDMLVGHARRLQDGETPIAVPGYAEQWTADDLNGNTEYRLWNDNHGMHNCAECPFAEYGSQGGGQACRQQRTLYMWMFDADGQAGVVPQAVRLAATSIKPMTVYNFRLNKAKAAAGGNLSFSRVVTRLDLEERSSGGNVWYVVKPASVRELSPDEVATARSMAEAYGLVQPQG